MVGTFCSELARHIHSSRNIAVVTTYLSDYIFPRVIQGIDEVLTGEGYSIILKNTRNSRSRASFRYSAVWLQYIWLLLGSIIMPSISFCKSSSKHLASLLLEEAGVSYDPDRVVSFYTEDRSMHPYERICQMAVQGEQTCRHLP